MTYRMRTRVDLDRTEWALRNSLELWGARDIQIGYNVAPRYREQNYKGREYLTRDERAVTVRWRTRAGAPVVLSLDSQESPSDNLRTLYLAIDAMRLNEKRGVDASVMRSAYLQLSSGEGDPYAVIGFLPGTAREEALSTFRQAAKSAHPDTGGSDELMASLNRAWSRVCELEGWQ